MGRPGRGCPPRRRALRTARGSPAAAVRLRLGQQVAEGVEELLEPGLVPHALLYHLLLAQVLGAALHGQGLRDRTGKDGTGETGMEEAGPGRRRGLGWAGPERETGVRVLPRMGGACKKVGHKDGTGKDGPGEPGMEGAWPGRGRGL